MVTVELDDASHRRGVVGLHRNPVGHRPDEQGEEGEAERAGGGEANPIVMRQALDIPLILDIRKNDLSRTTFNAAPNEYYRRLRSSLSNQKFNI